MCIDQSGDNPVSADVNNLRIIGQADLFVRANRRNPLATYQNDSLRKRLTSTVENSGARQGQGCSAFRRGNRLKNAWAQCGESP